jgi:hypothetical protein
MWILWKKMWWLTDGSWYMDCGWRCGGSLMVDKWIVDVAAHLMAHGMWMEMWWLIKV